MNCPLICLAHILVLYNFQSNILVKSNWVKSLCYGFDDILPLVEELDFKGFRWLGGISVRFLREKPLGYLLTPLIIRKKGYGSHRFPCRVQESDTGGRDTRVPLFLGGLCRRNH